MNNNIKQNNYIEERIWRHIINWIIYLILPFTFIDIIMFFILMENMIIILYYGLCLFLSFADYL